jgi:hypothetical protein
MCVLVNVRIVAYVRKSVPVMQQIVGIKKLNAIIATVVSKSVLKTLLNMQERRLIPDFTLKRKRKRSKENELLRSSPWNSDWNDD